MRLLMILLSYAFFNQSALGFFSLGLAGSSRKNYAGLETARYSSISGSLAIDLGDHFRIGLSHSRIFDYTDGYKTSTTNNVTTYVPYSDHTKITANSLDLTIVLYNGLVTPYIFAGVVNKYYDTSLIYPDQNLAYRQKFKREQQPNFGYGVAIFLSRNFNMKLTQTFSQGATVAFVDGAPMLKEKLDSVLEVGLNYRP